MSAVTFRPCRRRFAVAVCVLFGAAHAPSAPSLESGLFRIGTGGEKGTYFPVGSLIAEALTDHGAACVEGDGACGVSGLLAVAQLSNGSVSNVEAISAGVLEAGLVQADVAHGAYHGSGVFAGRPRQHQLRAIANLYPETVHVVAASGASITSIAELRGLRVSLDELGSGTLVDARLVLEAYGLGEEDLQPVYIKPHFAAERMTRGELDAFFIVAGHPTQSVSDVIEKGDARLLPIDAHHGAVLAARHPFLQVAEIPAGVYLGTGATPTLAVGAQLVVHAELDDETVYRVTAVLWNQRTAALLAGGHPKGSAIVLDNALLGIGIPLHPGAARFYRERGIDPGAVADARR